jgi:hypothetical protein
MCRTTDLSRRYIVPANKQKNSFLFFFRQGFRCLGYWMEKCLGAGNHGTGPRVGERYVFLISASVPTCAAMKKFGFIINNKNKWYEKTQAGRLRQQRGHPRDITASLPF